MTQLFSILLVSVSIFLTANPTKENNSAKFTHQLGFCSLKKESHNQKLTVHGSIPEWLNGSFISIGPGEFEINNTVAQNWLDGFGMIHQFAIAKGAVSYSNKLVNSAYYQECCKTGKIRGSKPEQKKSTWSKLTSAVTNAPRPVYDNANITVQRFNDQLIAATETPHCIKIDPRTLESKSGYAFDDKLDYHFCAAHSLFDPATQEWFGLGIQFAHMSNYIIYKMNQNCAKRTALATIPVGYPAYMHSFALTQNYIVLTEHPYVVSPYDLLLSDDSFIDNFIWKPQNGTTFLVFDRKTGKKIGSFKTDAFFTLHHVNAFEKENTIIIDLIAHKDAEILMRGFNYKDLCKGKYYRSLAHLKRYTLDLKTNKVTGTLVTSHILELPHINSTRLMHDYQYLYGTTGEHALANQLIKFDLHSKRHLTWHAKDCYPTEPIFAAKPHAKDEDDGVILSTVLDCHKGTSFLLVLDAKTMKELGRAYVAHHIPFTAHSKFFKE